QAAIRRPRGPSLITRHRRHGDRRSGGNTVLDRDNKDVEAFTTIGRVRNPGAVGRPGGLALDRHALLLRALRYGGQVRVSERPRLLAVRRHRPEAIEIRDGDALAVRRPRRLLNADRRLCMPNAEDQKASAYARSPSERA